MKHHIYCNIIYIYIMICLYSDYGPICAPIDVDARQEINEKRRSVQDRLDELGEGVPLDTAERVQVMWTLVTEPGS